MSHQLLHYDIDPQQRFNVLEGVADVTNAWDVVLSTVDLDRHRFVGKSPWLAEHPALFEPSTVVSTDDLLDRDQLIRTPYYRICLAPHGIVVGLVMVIERQKNEITWLHVLQTDDQRSFGIKDIDLLQSFHPLLLETLRVARCMDDLEQAQESFMDTLDHVSAGMALIDGLQVRCNQLRRT